MPLNRKRVQSIFMQAADYYEPSARGAFLDRECAAELELRGRIEAFLRAHDQFKRFLNDPVVGSNGRAKPWLA
jgi:hypothetical protein